MVGKDTVGERGDMKEVEEEGKEWVVWWEDGLAEVEEGKGDWSRDKIKGMGGVEKELFDRMFRVGKTFMRIGDGYRAEGEEWARVERHNRDRELNSLRIVMEVAIRFCGEEQGGVEARVSNVLWYTMTGFEKHELYVAKRHLYQGQELKGQEGERADLVGKRKRALVEVRS